jgi:putative tryptophan/tyrosine transport system substrate-binding protein
LKKVDWFSIFVTTALLTFSVRSEAQQTGKIFRIGFLDRGTASGNEVLLKVFRQELGKLGWVEGKNIAIEYRFADQKSERLPDLAAELVRLKVDVIVTGGSGPTHYAKQATATIPIVMAQDPDPVGNGLIASLARPGGNVTGFSILNTEISAKRLHLLKEASRRLSRSPCSVIRRIWVKPARSKRLLSHSVLGCKCCP